MGYVIQPYNPATAPTDVPVPDEVASDLAGFWDYMAAHPNEIAHVTFDTPEERNEFLAQARTWARGQGLIFRASGLSKLPDMQVRFRLSTPDDLDERRAKREAAKAAREAGTPAKRGRPARAGK